MIRVIVNKFTKRCTICNKNVLQTEGYSVYDNNWHTFHKECFPNCYQKPVETLASAKQISDYEVELNFKYDPYIVSLIKELNTSFRKFNADSKSWMLIINNETINHIKNIFKAIGVEQTKNVLEFIPSVDEICEDSESKVANEDTNYLKDKGLFDFQIEGVKFLRSKKRALLGDSMGLGKSLQSLSALPPNVPVLIISPSCVKYNWQREIQKWRSDYKPVIIGSKNDFVLPENNQIVIANRENIPDFYDKNDESHKEKFTKDLIAKLKTIHLIVDEAHKFKSTKTIGSKKLRSISMYSKVCWLLTGTPILNKALDLWGVMYAGNMEKEVFENFDRFLYLFNGKQGKFGLEYGMPRPEVPSIISKVRLARSKDEVLPQLPKKIFTKMVVSLKDTEEGQRIIKLLDSIDPEIIKMIYNDGGLPPFNTFSTIRSQIAKNRIPALLEYIEDCEENEIPIIVFSQHIAPLNALRMKSNWGIIDGSTPAEDRQMIVENFQNGILDGIACTIAAGGVGLTMTRAQKVIFVDLDWTPANNWQAEDRICRIGSKHNSVEIIHMISDHPLDCHVHNLLEQKKDLISKTLG